MDGKTTDRIKNSFIMVALSICTVMLVPKLAQAEEKMLEPGPNHPSFRIGAGEAFGVGWTKGEAKAQEPGFLFSFGVVQDIGVTDDITWKFTTDLFMAVPNTVFHPAPRIVPGITLKKDWFSFGMSLMYQWNPPYNDKPNTHVFGVTVGPGFAITKDIVLALALGYRVTIGNPSLTHSLALGPTLFLKLPF